MKNTFAMCSNCEGIATDAGAVGSLSQPIDASILIRGHQKVRWLEGAGKEACVEILMERQPGNTVSRGLLAPFEMMNLRACSVIPNIAECRLMKTLHEVDEGANESAGFYLLLAVLLPVGFIRLSRAIMFTQMFS